MKIKALLYCTKAKNKNDYLIKNYLDEYVLVSKYLTNTKLALNGKIVCECNIETEEIDTGELSEHVYEDYYRSDIDMILERSCLTGEQMAEYLRCNWDSKGYALHISNIKVFDKPR